MRVLHVSHTSVISGAEHSLLVLLRAWPAEVRAELACPEGELARAARADGIAVHIIPGTDLSARLHPVHTPRELARVALGVRAVRQLAGAGRFDVLHANTPRAAMLAAGAAPPLVTHVRDVVPPGALPRRLFTLLGARTSAWLVTTGFLADDLPVRARAGGRPLVRVVANAVEPARFDPALVDGRVIRAQLGLAPGDPVLALVGQISPHKAQSDAIEMLSALRASGLPAHLLLAGAVKFTSSATRFDNRAYERSCRELASRLGVDSAVHWLGERPDVDRVLAAADLALVPSWYEPFGRVALEAMMMEVPVLATARGGVREVVRHGVDGLVLDPGDPAAWSAAASDLLRDGARRARMGRAGRERALSAFGPAAHAAAMAATCRAAAAGNRLVRRGLSDSLIPTSETPSATGTGVVSR